ncbi:MAG: DUF1273 domain-containing protein [Ruminococcaceae bacterium]|nr:DUF1273 domain-containing protein [Oscillospiraceae bacterium]
MFSCTFFGHRNTSKEIKPLLKNILIDLIENKNITKFYVGTHGSFDITVQKLLKELKEDYPHINYYIVLAYLPQKNNSYNDYDNTIYPDLENIPLKYAIIERNKWMINKSDYIVCYVENTFSNAHKFLELARKKNKIIINLYSK